MLLKSHYELDVEYDERTVKIFRTTGQFISNNKTLPGKHKIAYKNLIQLTINLYRLRFGIGKRTLVSIKQKMQDYQLVGDRKWLVGKINELEVLVKMR